MNWIDNKEYPLVVHKDWNDVWKSLHTTKNPGYTYDQKINDMLPGKRYRTRLDRIFVNQPIDKSNNQISMIGNEQIGSLTYFVQNRRTGNQEELPVFPSDHFGLLFKKKL